MRLVLDANIAISSLIAGSMADLIFSPKISLIAPELLFIEIRRHKEEIMKKSDLSFVDFDLLLALIEGRVAIVPMKEFIYLLPKAEKLLAGHKKDAPYVALALKFDCPVWSYEKRFKTIGHVESLTTAEVRARLKSQA
jgi:predicted nucleic acid-binding protein